jgi:mediator of RNA polymerase II transcription subunit 12, fungi type
VPSIIPLLVEKTNMLLQKLVLIQTDLKSISEDRSGMISDQTQLNFERKFTFWFTALLHLTVLHRSAFDSSQSASQRPSALLEQSRLLIAICCIALSWFPTSPVSHSFEAGHLPPYMSANQRLRAGNSLQTYALDVAALLVDTLPDEARQQCGRFLKERCPPLFQVQNEPRLLYLLGPITDPSFSTASSQPISVPSPAASGPACSSIPSSNPLAGSTSSQNLTVTPAVVTPTAATEDPVSIINRLRIQRRGRVVGPYFFRPWEMLEEAAPVVGVNDAAIDLGYFGARKVRE